MLTLQQLIKKYCPDGVEYKSLGEIATEIYKGNGLHKNKVGSGNYPCVSYDDVKDNLVLDSSISTTDDSLIKNKKYCSKGDLLLTADGMTLEDIVKPCAYLGNENCIVAEHVLVFKHKQNPKYLSYALSTNYSTVQKQKYAANYISQKNKNTTSSLRDTRENSKCSR